MQAFLDARTVALAAAASAAGPAPNAAGESQDEFAFEFAPMDFDDPSLRLLLGEADVPAAAAATTTANGGGASAAEPAESPAAVLARQDRAFAAIVGDTVSPAIYRLLGNVLSADAEGWQRLVGGAGATAAAHEDAQAREAYVARLVDCWAGCAAVLVAHGLKVRQPPLLSGWPSPRSES